MTRTYSDSRYVTKKAGNKDWDTVLANPVQIKIITLKTGTIQSKVSGIINLNRVNASQLRDRAVKIPVLAHVITHEKYGDYLIDTGFDSSFANKAGGSFKGLLKSIYFKDRYFQEDESAGIENQLKGRCIDLKGVFLTHFHEHAAGAPSLSDEIPFISGYGETEAGFFPLVYSDFFKNKICLQKIDFSQGQDMPIFGKCVDIFGDGSFWAVSTPGHTKGHTSFIINGREIQAIVTGDACISKKGFELLVETGKNSMNRKEGRESFLKIVQFAESYACIKKIFGHETEEFTIDYI